MSGGVVRQIDLPGRPVRRGKVRDVFDLGDRLLIVATDRISAFDCVLPDAIPDKGRILTGLSGFWFERFSGRIPHHLIEVVGETVPAGFEPVAEQLRGRAMLCRKARVVPIECVARGYLAGSGWAEYRRCGSICGVALPAGLRHCERLAEPIFTPATKSDAGHDENLSFDAAAARVGRALLERLRALTLALYKQASVYLLERGILLADTKFEFGLVDDASGGEARILLIDEVLTPDSSRFWPAEDYSPGRAQASFDKQFVRDYLQGLCDAGKWDKTDPAPALPAEVIAATRERYLEAWRRITGGGPNEAVACKADSAAPGRPRP